MENKNKACMMIPDMENDHLKRDLTNPIIKSVVKDERCTEAQLKHGQTKKKNPKK